MADEATCCWASATTLVFFLIMSITTIRRTGTATAAADAMIIFLGSEIRGTIHLGKRGSGPTGAGGRRGRGLPAKRVASKGRVSTTS